MNAPAKKSNDRHRPGLLYVACRLALSERVAPPPSPRSKNVLGAGRLNVQGATLLSNTEHNRG